MRKRVVFIANSLNNAYKFQHVLSEFSVEVTAGSTKQMGRLLAPGYRADLVIFEVLASTEPYLEEAMVRAESQRCSLLLIVDEASLGRLRLPASPPCDFVMSSADDAECSARIRRLLGEGAARQAPQVITVDGMIINLDTYQVEVDGEPADFTYLEYALLAYLAQHPERTFSREALLQSVWGFDYSGGTRTVDVHVRRIRAKLGPKLAQHLETVRGVGYLWRER